MGFLKRLFGKKDSKKEPEQQPEKKTETKKAPETKKADPESKQEKKPSPTKKTATKYHVSLNRDEKSEFYKMWRVRKEQSEKTIKYFKTQEEAIDYAEDLADDTQSSVVIHKKDGSIRKQDYKKKS